MNTSIILAGSRERSEKSDHSCLSIDKGVKPVCEGKVRSYVGPREEIYPCQYARPRVALVEFRYANTTRQDTYLAFHSLGMYVIQFHGRIWPAHAFF